MSECCDVMRVCIVYVCIVYVASHARVAAGFGRAGCKNSDHGSYERTTDETSFRYERDQRERELEALPHHNLQDPIEAQ
jgi:hypothetical protein